MLHKKNTFVKMSLYKLITHRIWVIYYITEIIRTSYNPSEASRFSDIIRLRNYNRVRPYLIVLLFGQHNTGFIARCLFSFLSRGDTSVFLSSYYYVRKTTRLKWWWWICGPDSDTIRLRNVSNSRPFLNDCHTRPHQTYFRRRRRQDRLWLADR